MVSILSELNKINFISPILHTVPVAQFSRCFAGDFRKLLKVVRELSLSVRFSVFFLLCMSEGCLDQSKTQLRLHPGISFLLIVRDYLERKRVV